MNAKLIRICLHWTAGGLTPNRHDKDCYHFIVDFEGVVHVGYYTPESNFKQLSNRDKYAQHCGGGNSWTVGVAVCGAIKGRNGFKGETFTKASLQSALKQIAKLCRRYNIAVTDETVYTHYEFGLKHKGTDSAGKVDIDHIPWEPSLKPQDVGDWLRTKVKWYLVNP